MVKRKYRIARPIEKTAFIVGGIFLLLCWGMVVMYFSTGNMYGHKNYYNQAVGSISFAAACLVGTIVYLVALWRHRVSHIFEVIKNCN
jgi:hypothetical protein